MVGDSHAPRLLGMSELDKAGFLVYVYPVIRRRARNRSSAVILGGLSLGPASLGAASPVGQRTDYSVFLPLVAKSTPPDPTAPPPSSENKIDQTVADGTISAEAGLEYKVFALFGDDRLPAQFIPSAGNRVSSAVTAKLSSLFSTLSPQAQAALRPFTLPPDDPSSWYQLRRGSAGLGAQAVAFTYRNTANGKVRVGVADDVPDGAAKLDALVAAIDGTIWPKLVEVMKTEPKPSSSGSGKLDVFIVMT